MRAADAADVHVDVLLIFMLVFWFCYLGKLTRDEGDLGVAFFESLVTLLVAVMLQGEGERLLV